MIDETLTADQPNKNNGEGSTTPSAFPRNRQIVIIDGFDSESRACMRVAASLALNSTHVAIGRLILTRERVFDSLKAFSATYEALALDLDRKHESATAAQPVVQAWFWATPLALPTNESRWTLSECLPSPELSWTEILELYGIIGSQVLRDLRLRIDRLRGLVRYLTGRIGVVIRRVGRPHFDCTFVGLQKSFHLLHGAHPPRYRAGLSSGRRSNLIGGCVQAISSNTV